MASDAPPPPEGGCGQTKHFQRLVLLFDGHGGESVRGARRNLSSGRPGRRPGPLLAYNTSPSRRCGKRRWNAQMRREALTSSFLSEVDVHARRRRRAPSCCPRRRDPSRRRVDAFADFGLVAGENFRFAPPLRAGHVRWPSPAPSPPGALLGAADGIRGRTGWEAASASVRCECGQAGSRCLSI